MGWPDHFVPDSAIGCRQLHEHAKKFGDKKPIVVHCSAGVGKLSFVLCTATNA